MRLFIGKRYCTRRGMTLAEVMIVTILIGLVFIGGISALIPFGRLLTKERRRIRISNELNTVTDWITRDAARAISLRKAPGEVATSVQLDLSPPTLSVAIRAARNVTSGLAPHSDFSYTRDRFVPAYWTLLVGDRCSDSGVM